MENCDDLENFSSLTFVEANEIPTITELSSHCNIRKPIHLN